VSRWIRWPRKSFTSHLLHFDTWETLHSPSILVCIPAKDEESTIAKVVIKASQHANRVLVCDDGSSDMTGEIARRLGAEVLRNESASGYGVALSILFKRAARLRPDVMVTIDADGQHDPDDIPRLVAPILRNQADLVIGSRFAGKKPRAMRAYRTLGIKGITRLTAATSGFDLTDAQSGFRAYSFRAIRGIVPVEQGMGASSEILIRAGEKKLRVVEVPVGVKYKDLRTSTYNPIFHGLDVTASIIKLVSLRHPLLSFGGLGLATILIGLTYGFYTIQIYSVQMRPITNVSILSMAIVSSGLLLLFMGIILFTLTSLINENR
jgi:glycosyltransferase involved in cell wall biosynthesis